MKKEDLDDNTKFWLKLVEERLNSLEDSVKRMNLNSEDELSMSDFPEHNKRVSEYLKANHKPVVIK